MLTWEYPPYIVGGLGRHVSELALALTKAGVSVHVVTIKRQTSDKDYRIENNIVIHRVTPLLETGSFFDWVASVNLAIEEKAREIIERCDIGVIHAHDWIVAAASIILKRHCKLPLMATIHSTESGRHRGVHTESQYLIDRQEKLLMESADQLVVCSQFMRNELQYPYQQPASKVTVIPNGVSELYKKANAVQHHIDSPEGYLFSMGRMVEEKGFDILIKLAEKYKEKKVALKIIVAGSGPLLSFYRQKVKAKQVDESIRFIGFVDDMERDRWLATAKLAVFPSLYEPFGIVALEAMTAGVPVILAKTGGFQEIIVENQSGLFFNPSDVEDLESKINCLLSQSNSRNEMIIAAQKRVRTHFSWQSVAQQTMKLYQKIINEPINSKGKGDYSEDDRSNALRN